jgi:hypothetical protein
MKPSSIPKRQAFAIAPIARHSLVRLSARAFLPWQLTFVFCVASRSFTLRQRRPVRDALRRSVPTVARRSASCVISSIKDCVPKLHEDTLKQLIGQRITESDLPAPEKSKLLEQLKALPGEAIKHLTLKLVDAGLANWPIAVQAIEHFVHAPK